MSEVVINNVGPIEHLEIPIPEHGGVVVLRGGQGVGKSTAIQAISKALGGNAKGLTTRDGEQRGTVEFGQARLSVTRSRTTKRGSIEVAEIDSKLDLSKLVDPQIDDPEKADAARMRALVNLTGVEANPADYYELVGGKDAFESLAVDTSTKSPVELAGRVKRALEREARKFEKQSDQEAGKAAAAAAISEGVDLAAESDPAKLQAAYDVARDKVVSLVERKRAYDEQESTRAEARKNLEAAESSYAGPDPSSATEAIEATRAQLQEALEAKNAAEQAYLEAKDKLADVQGKHNQAVANLHAAEQHYRNMEGWREALGTSVAAGPTDAEIEQARAEQAEAQQRIELGAKVRAVREQEKVSQAHKHAANNAKKVSTLLRDAAKGTDEVLSSLIPSGPLRVEAGRLVLTTDRGTEPYAELSEGERWKLAIDLAAEQLPPHGLLTAPQVAWEGLTLSTREQVKRHAVERGVVIITAEAVDGELGAEVA